MKNNFIEEKLKEFEEKFVEEFKDENGRVAYTELRFIDDSEEIKEFFKQALLQSRLNTLEEIEDKIIDKWSDKQEIFMYQIAKIIKELK